MKGWGGGGKEVDESKKPQNERERSTLGSQREKNITSNLSWSMQANKCTNKANSVLEFIRRMVGPKNPELFSKLYKSLVRLIL